MNIGHSSRLGYDDCVYPDKLKESVGPTDYRLNRNYIHNCNRCFNHNGAGPRSSFGTSTIKKVGHAPANDLVDVDSIMSNRNVKLTKSKTGKLNPINLTTHEPTHYIECDNYNHPQHSRLTLPPSNYRDVSINRFYNTLHDPQANIFTPFARNSRLEAKDNYQPELPVLWDDRVAPIEYEDDKTRCGIVCRKQC